MYIYTNNNHQPPNPVTLLTTLLTTLHTLHPPPPSPSPSSSMAPLPPSTKPHLLTLHALLPQTLLPALDLLDRGFLTRYSSAISINNKEEEGVEGEAEWDVVYYTRSSSSSSSGGKGNVKNGGGGSCGAVYETRLAAWYCSCASYAFYAYIPSQPVDETEELVDLLPSPPRFSSSEKSQDPTAWIWGGKVTQPGYASPIVACKHLVAATLAERVPGLFGGCVGRREGCGVEEMAEMAVRWD